jgi:hypothetical protein
LTGAGVDSATGIVGAGAAVDAVCSGIVAGVVSCGPGADVAGGDSAGETGSSATGEGTPRSGATGTGTVD